MNKRLQRLMRSKRTPNGNANILGVAMKILSGLPRVSFVYASRALVISTVMLSAATLGGAPPNLPQMDGVPTAKPEDVGMSSARLVRLSEVMQTRRIAAFNLRRATSGSASC